MSIKFRFVLAVIFFVIFAICCLIALFFHRDITSEVGVNILVWSSGLSAILFPVFLVSAIRKYLENRNTDLPERVINFFRKFD